MFGNCHFLSDKRCLALWLMTMSSKIVTSKIMANNVGKLTRDAQLSIFLSLNYNLQLEAVYG